MINGEDVVEKRRQEAKERHEDFVAIILSSIFAITIACMIWIGVTHRRNYQYDGAYVDKNQTMWEIEYNANQKKYRVKEYTSVKTSHGFGKWRYLKTVDYSNHRPRIAYVHYINDYRDFLDAVDD